MYKSFVLSLFPIYLFNYFYYFGDLKRWQKFTKIISMINAIQCVIMVFYNLYIYENIELSLNHLYFFPDIWSTYSLYFFCSYLYIDGMFDFLNNFLQSSFNILSLMSLLHHFVGGYGIYLISTNRLGFFLGFYFAMTEISTIFLNISWHYRTKTTFKIFYFTFFVCRILTIPLLLSNISKNSFYLTFLPDYYISFIYYGSYCLILLNITWFILLTNHLRKM